MNYIFPFLVKEVGQVGIVQSILLHFTRTRSGYFVPMVKGGVNKEIRVCAIPEMKCNRL